MTKEELDKSIEDAAITLLYNDEEPEPAEIFLEEMSWKRPRSGSRKACAAWRTRRRKR